MYNIGEQLYIINKYAKQLRNMRRELKDQLFMSDKGHFSKITLVELKKRKDGLIYNTDSITFCVDGEEYKIEKLHRSQAFEFKQRILKEIEDCCRDCYPYAYSSEEELEKDIETSQEIASQEIAKAQEALDNLHQTLYDWGALCRRIYATKNIIITTLADSIFLGIHKFPDGYREYYQIGDYTFHSSFLCFYNANGSEPLELEEIEADSKIEITPAKIDEALNNAIKLANELKPLYNANKYTDVPTIHDSCYGDVDNADYEEDYEDLFK